MKEQKTTYNAIANLSNEELKLAYKELAGDVKGKPIARKIQSELYQENGKIISLISVMYHISLEVNRRFCNID